MRKTIQLLLQTLLFFWMGMGLPTEAAAQRSTCNCGVPQNVTVQHVSTTTYSIAWAAPAVGEVIGYTVRTTNVATGAVMEDQTTATAFTKTGLSPNTQYSVQVIARCNCGQSPPSSGIIVITGVITQDIIVQRGNLPSPKDSIARMMPVADPQLQPFWSPASKLESIEVRTSQGVVLFKIFKDSRTRSTVYYLPFYSGVTVTPVHRDEVEIRIAPQISLQPHQRFLLTHGGIVPLSAGNYLFVRQTD